MNKQKWRHIEYRRNDYYMPRSSREAFGVQVYDEDLVTFGHVVHIKTNWGDVAVVALCLVVAVGFMFFGFGGN